MENAHKPSLSRYLPNCVYLTKHNFVKRRLTFVCLKIICAVNVNLQMGWFDVLSLNMILGLKEEILLNKLQIFMGY